MFGKKTPLSREQEEQIRRRVNEARAKPLTVVVMGQTGVGKSSLINALFGTRLKTNDVRPETKEPEKHVAGFGDGHELWFWDMPGIGESSAADAYYLGDYRQKIMEADVALWLCHADSRSVTFDMEAIQRILGGLPAQARSAMFSKLTFVLSKADLVAPEPWILYRRQDFALFEASGGTKELLDAKAEYFRDALIRPHADLFVSRTHYSGSFNLRLDALRADGHFVHYPGVMSRETLDRLRRSYPDHADVFLRLYQNSEVVYCSSRFRYNLARLMRTVVDRIGGEASIRFRNLTLNGQMNRVPWDRARTFSNVLVFDEKRDEIVFNLAEVD